MSRPKIARRLLTPLLLVPLLSVASAQTTLKAVLNGEVHIIDPIATTNYRTRDFAYLVWDVLIAVDSKGNYRPQMLESFTASADNMHYTFTLRPGLKWSDGTSVTAQDCIASIKRWAARDALGKQLLARSKTLTAISDTTFTLELEKPFGFVIQSLGKPGSNVPVMMPERLAQTDPTKPVDEVIGSGPFVFLKDEWVPGDRMVFEKNPHYIPRDEPADGLAGGKHVYVDRVELITMPDSATAVAALQTGEIDYIQRISFDYLPILQQNPGVVLSPGQKGNGSFIFIARPNHLQPPFNNPKIRQALQALVDQKEILSSLGAPAELADECYSVYMCNTPYASDAGTEALRSPSIEKAKRLLEEGGYQGEKIVVLHSADLPTIHYPATVLEEQMRRAGFNVDVQASDYATVAQRRFSKETIENGGWSLMPLNWEAFDVGTPLTHYAIAHNCTDGYPGWSCDEETKRLLAEVVEETNEEKRRALMDQIQLRAHENVSLILGGQFTIMTGYRSNLAGVLTEAGLPVFWNIRK